MLFGQLTSKLIAENSTSYPGTAKGSRYVDIVRDVIKLIPIYFVSTDLMGLPIKTELTRRGLYRASEFSAMFEDVCKCVPFLSAPPSNTDPLVFSA